MSDAYTATLARLKTQKGSRPTLGLKALMWVLNSEGPIRAEGLCHALGVEIGSADLDLEKVPALKTLLACCQGLVTVEASSSTVRLVHFTLQEHLSSDPTLSHSSHSTIAEVCLTYLNFGSVRNLSPTLRSPPSTMPLLEYASWYWGEHARYAVTENIKILALRLLSRFDEHISAQLLLLRSNQERGYDTYFDESAGPSGFTGLHGAAYLGIVEIFAVVSEIKEWDFNAVDCMGCTALIWAVRRGNEGVLKVLLERGNVNRVDTKYGRTPLSWAAYEGNEAVVKVLVEREDVNPNHADTQYGRTPLSWAAEFGHEGVAKILLEREDVNPNHADTKDGFTPLHAAAYEGNEGVVKMLLEREDVNPNHANTKYGLTPLFAAAHEGHEGVVKMLLEREDVNPNHADTKHGRTPLSWAAYKGNDWIVKALLQREDVNPNHADTKNGQTPLSRAAYEGNEVIVKILLERKDINPNHADTKYGLTPLLAATHEGHEGIVKILLEREDVNPNQADTKNGRTPLLIAAREGREGVVKMLLEREDVNPNHSDTKYGRAPLSWAAEGGHEGVVRMLLKQKDVNPDSADTKYGRTPLWWAAVGGYEGIVRVLLEREDVDPNLENAENVRMPLSWKVGNGCVEIVKAENAEGTGESSEYFDRGDSNGSYWEVLEYSDSGDSDDSDLEDNESSDCGDRKAIAAPQSLALPERDDGVARILVDPDNANSGKVNLGGQPSLLHSPVNRDESVEMQLRSHDPNADVISLHGQRDLTPAAHDEPPKILDPQSSISMSADHGPSTKSPWWSQPLSIWPLKLCCCRRQTRTHPSNI